MGEIVSRLAAVLLYAGLQGVLLASLARLLGDKRPLHDGRLSPNPLTHLSVWGAAIAALFGVSWIRNIWFDARQNRLGRPGLAVVTVGGLVAMVVAALLIGLIQPLAVFLPRTGSYTVLYVLEQFRLIAVSSIVLNILPVPGLIGGGLLQSLWPERERQFRRAEPICLAIIVAAIVAFGFPDVTALNPFG